MYKYLSLFAHTQRAQTLFYSEEKKERTDKKEQLLKLVS